LSKLRRLLAKMEPDDRKLILHLTQGDKKAAGQGRGSRKTQGETT
jgi:hypothetical protein